MPATTQAGPQQRARRRDLGAGAPPGGAGAPRPEPEPAERPLGSYAAFATVFVAAFGGTLIAARRRLPERLPSGDLVLGALATHKLSRLISRERVAAPLRAPFTEVQAEDPPLELRERPVGRGPRRALGELLTCPFCLDQWIAAAFTVGLLLAPRPTRAVAGMFAIVTGSDYLQHVHRWVRSRG